MDDRLVKILFSFWGESEPGIAFSKMYPNTQAAKESIARFLSQIESIPMAMPGNSSAEAVDNIIASKKLFFKELLNNTIPLPDNGQGFDFHGDRDHISMILDCL